MKVWPARKLTVAALSLDKTPCGSEINKLQNFSASISVMNSTYVWARASVGLSPCSVFRSQQSLLIENLAPRQQLAVFKRRNARPRLIGADKVVWVFLRRFWSSWRTALLIVSPDTVVRWHRAGFQLYWRLISRVRKPIGRRPVTKEIRELIFKTMAENPTWRAPRIHGELAMPGFDVSERSVSRWSAAHRGRLCHGTTG